MMMEIKNLAICADINNGIDKTSNNGTNAQDKDLSPHIWANGTGGKRTWLESFVIRILKCGAIPQHVAFIMDGNRRFARKANIDRVSGHTKGFETLAKVLEWCKDLGVKEVTLYAFSVENFKRPKDEVDGLMELARKKFDSLLNGLEQINQRGLRIRVAGELDLLPQDLQERIEEVHKNTCNNTSAYLNICLAYTSRHEITSAIRNIAAQQQESKLNMNEDTNFDLEDRLYLPRPFPELIIRTSGEDRLSDFMLWQCQDSLLIFVKALWPEITIWDLFRAVFLYQSHLMKIL